jgi:hypothetical protein
LLLPVTDAKVAAAHLGPCPAFGITKLPRSGILMRSVPGVVPGVHDTTTTTTTTTTTRGCARGHRTVTAMAAPRDSRIVGRSFAIATTTTTTTTTTSAAIVSILDGFDEPVNIGLVAHGHGPL